MKRDMELIRKILLKVEESDEASLAGMRFQVEGYDEIVVACHVKLLHEAGLVDANVLETQIGTTAAWIHRLTWSGHEFLDAARNEAIWQRAMGLLKTKGGTVPFDVLKALLTAKAKEWIGLEV